MSTGFIGAFQHWLEANAARLAREEIRTQVYGPTPFTPSSLHVEFLAECCECAVQVWENGLSDFHFLDLGAATRAASLGVESTHH